MDHYGLRQKQLSGILISYCIFAYYLLYPKIYLAGLRSGRQGEQCETIVRFPRLFEKYPFPILINSACLKLAEVFRGNQ